LKAGRKERVGTKGYRIVMRNKSRFAMLQLRLRRKMKICHKEFKRELRRNVATTVQYRVDEE
jgi:hypothetical protein